MTEKEQLLEFINKYCIEYYSYLSFEDIICGYINFYKENFTLGRLYEFLNKINQQCFQDRVENADRLRWVAKERAGYLKKYLEGKMWKTEELARQYVEPQIENAQVILDVCENK